MNKSDGSKQLIKNSQISDNRLSFLKKKDLLQKITWIYTMLEKKESNIKLSLNKTIILDFKYSKIIAVKRANAQLLAIIAK